jgi:hypothetical protein
MEQDINLPPLGPAGGMAGNPFETLQVGLAPDVYQAMEVVLTSFDQHFQALEHTIVSSQSIQSAIQNSFASTIFVLMYPQLLHLHLQPCLFSHHISLHLA